MECRQQDQPVLLAKPMEFQPGFCLRNDALSLDDSLSLRLTSNSRSLGDSFARSDPFWVFLFCGGRF